MTSRSFEPCAAGWCDVVNDLARQSRSITWARLRLVVVAMFSGAGARPCHIGDG
jgi:hypothetical protein